MGLKFLEGTLSELVVGIGCVFPDKKLSHRLLCCVIPFFVKLHEAPNSISGVLYIFLSSVVPFNNYSF
jgi:hypothetical protein